MSVSFGLKTSTPKKRTPVSLAAFAEPADDEPEAILSESEKLAESERLQVLHYSLPLSAVSLHVTSLTTLFLLAE